MCCGQRCSSCTESATETALQPQLAIFEPKPQTGFLGRTMGASISQSQPSIPPFMLDPWPGACPIALLSFLASAAPPFLPRPCMAPQCSLLLGLDDNAMACVLLQLVEVNPEPQQLLLLSRTCSRLHAAVQCCSGAAWQQLYMTTYPKAALPPTTAPPCYRELFKERYGVHLGGGLLTSPLSCCCIQTQLPHSVPLPAGGSGTPGRCGCSARCSACGCSLTPRSCNGSCNSCRTSCKPSAGRSSH